MAQNLEIVQDGDRHVVVKFTTTNATGDDAAATLDISTLNQVNNRPGWFNELSLKKLWCVSDVPVHLEWEATSNAVAYVVPPGNEDKDFTSFGGFDNTAGAGKTGNVVINPQAVGSMTLTAVFTKQKGS